MKAIRRIIFLLCIFASTANKINAQCNAKFTLKTDLCFGQSIQFLASDTSASLTYIWDFGDVFSGMSNSDTLRNPVHLFSQPDTFTVTLIVADTNACRDTVYKTIIILGKPSADFSVKNGCVNTLALYSDLSKVDKGDTVKSWNWNLGNSATSTYQNPTHIYSSTGWYTVELIVKTKAGCRDTIKKSIQIFKLPTAKSDKLKVCKNSEVNFVADTLNAAKSFNWSFGDSSFFSVRSATHVYKKTGYLNPSLSVDFGSTTCNILLDSILVHPLPDASFIGLKDTQCYKNNLVCIKLVNQPKNLKSRTILFDDGSYDDKSAMGDSIICHNYSDAKGGAYFITAELMDSNTCMAAFTSAFPVIIYPELIAKFTVSGANGCFKTQINVTNTSNKVPPKITAYHWDFGDGGKDSTKWSNFNYTYTAGGNFSIKLDIKDSNGCSDSYTNVSTVSNTSFTVDARLDSSRGKCFNNNTFYFKQTPIAGASIRWIFDGNVGSNSFTPNYGFLNPGIYFPRVTISKNGCDSTLVLDSIVVHGPQARIGNILNRFQCQIKDTVYFSNTSTLFRNSSMQARWDAGDAFAPNCTTISKDSVNIGKNCRYSKDPLFFKHLYKKGKEACYYTKLVVMDSIVGCKDSVTEAIPLMAPKAKGLFTPSNTLPCPGPESYKSLSFDLYQSQPSCLKYAWWVMWDSLGARKSGNFNSFWISNSLSHLYPYGNYPGDSSGKVSIGLIVENGLDTNGKVCRDTGWFHHTVKVTQMSPVFSSNYSVLNYYCPNSSIKFFAKDSTQAAGTRFVWNFGDGNSINTTSQSAVWHRFKKAGKYLVSLTVSHPNGCSGTTNMWVNIGVYKHFIATSALKCVKDSIQLIELNRYFDTLSTGQYYWSNPIRALAGKELLHYNIGDGNGYKNLGANPKIKYKHPGIYKISMAIKDSAGCWDTVSNYQTIRISGVYANFKLPSDSLLCAQTVDIVSLATTIDSTGLSGDFVKTWDWDFGPRYAKSYSNNPKRFFAIDGYKIKLKVSNAYGCVDSITKPLVIIGPRAAYDFIGDTVGCEPLSISFKNKSKNASSFNWQFKDKGNATFGTSKDTNIRFQYSGQGSFYPQLVARGQYTKNGITQTCDDIYPDTSLPMKRTVIVWELPKPKFTWTTNCATSTTSFQNKSTISTDIIEAVKWVFGDKTSSTSLNPVHVYADTGHYRVVLYAYSNRGCMDSVVNSVVVSYVPIANFSFKSACQGVGLGFIDSSYAYTDRIYLWRWSFGNGTFSNVKNPNKSYAQGNTYSVKLKVTNIAGCSDSITKSVLVYSKPIPDFSVSNVCDKSEMKFNNTSTSQQTLQSWVWNFGDGSTSNSYNANRTYGGQGNYAVKLRLTTQFGCKDSIIKTVTVYPNPKAKIFINQKNQCFKYHAYNLIDSSKISSGITTSKWVFQNKDTSNLANVNYKYSASGNYTLKLISISGFNCRDTASDSVNVWDMPKVNFSINQINQCSRYNAYKLDDLGSIAQGTYSRQWIFGDGNKSINNPAQHHYNDTGVFKLSLILTSNNGCKDTGLKNVSVWPMPNSKFAVNDTSQCLNGNSFIFTNSSSMAWGGLTYRWEFGDNGSANSVNTTHNYASPGVYTILLESKSIHNCKDTFRQVVSVNPMPNPAFRIDDSLQCLNGNTFKFNNLSSVSSGTLSYKWDFGDGNFSNQKSPQHIFLKDSSYKIKLKAMSSYGCQDSVDLPSIVYPMPKLGFVINTKEQCLRSNQYNFSNTTTLKYGNLTHKWSFGDTGKSILKSPGYIYTQYGTYAVKLHSTSNFGCSDSISDLTRVNPMPATAFSTNDSTQCQNVQNFIFTDISTLPLGNLTRKWVFDDATNSNLKIVSKTFAQDTVHRVRLIQTSDKGCLDTLTKWMEVYSVPKVDFAINDSDQCLYQNDFIFSNKSKIRKGTYTLEWTFGDNAVSTLLNPTHTYLTYGNYTLTLLATSENLCRDSLKKIIRVDPMPTVSFVVNDSGQCINDHNFIFTNTSTISVGTLGHLWKFGDGVRSILSNPSKTFTKDTSYRVWLTETSNKGCKDSIFKYIEVHPKPKVYFSISDSVQCLFQNMFSFANASDIKSGNLSFIWNFGDATTASALNSSHTYASSGTFKVRLHALSNLGCRDSLNKNITVAPMPKVDFSINDRGQCFRIQNFIFTNRSSISSGNMRPTWHFGDQDSVKAQHATHVYKTTGSFESKLIMNSNYGCKDSMSQFIWVNPNANAHFVTNDSDQCLNQQDFSFQNNSTVSAGQIKSLLWNFGNGKTATQNLVKSYYPQSGVYSIILQTTTDSGCIDSFKNSIRVYPKPKAKFLINDSAQCLYQNQYILTDNSFDSIGSLDYTWNINNENQQSGFMATYKFASSGKKVINLNVVSQVGCGDTIKRDVYVKPMPDPSFEQLKSYYCELTGPYTFIPVTIGGNFYGKNSSTNIYKPIILWDDTLKYRVTVNGCTDSSFQYTKVYPGPRVDLGADTILCKYEALELVVKSWQSEMIWSTGNHGPKLKILHPGIYSVRVTNICGTKSDTIEVGFRPINCRFFLPTAFTPNDDGLNDRYKPIIYDVGQMKYRIFSRWGEILYEGTESDRGWDGSYKGEAVPLGNYLIHATYTYKSGDHYMNLEESGMFVLIR